MNSTIPTVTFQTFLSFAEFKLSSPKKEVQILSKGLSFISFNFSKLKAFKALNA